MFRNRVLLVVTGSVVLVAALAVAGLGLHQAFAASPSGNTSSSSNSYCQLYLSTLESQLGKSQSDLVTANQQAAEAVINQMAADGKITAEQKSQLEKRVQNTGQNPCAFLGHFAKGAPRGANGKLPKGGLGALANARNDVLSKVATALGNMSASDLTSALQSGQTVQQIASSKGVALDTVKQAYLGAVQSDLATAVSNNLITSQQSSAILTRIQNSLNNNQFPLLDRPARGPHMGWHGAPIIPGSATAAPSTSA